MAANFPTGATALETGYVDSVNDVLAANQNQPNFEINAIAAKVGLNSSADTSTHDYKLSGVTSTAKAFSTANIDTDTTLAANSDTKVASQKAVKTYADTKTTLAAVLSAVYPIGCIYMSVVSTNPNTVFGFGTWSAWGTGRVPVGFDDGQTEFDTVEETGGEKTPTLTGAESGTSEHAHTIPDKWEHTGSASINGGTTHIAQALTTTTSNSVAANASSAHNNLQPYIVCYMFKRTA
jgi:hypothetical protein